MKTRLSKSVLEDFLRCGRCFWLAKNKEIKTPQGIKSSLPIGMDSKIKDYHDVHRKAGTIPPEIEGKVFGGLLKDQIKLNKWRNWRSALTVDIDRFTLSGMFDDILFDPATGLYAGYDYKTKGKAPEDGYSQKYYAIQAAAYDLLLTGNGMKTNGKFYFSYWFPQEIHGYQQTWGVEVQVLEPNHNDLKSVVIAAGECLEKTMPESDPGCELCNYISNRLDAIS